MSAVAPAAHAPHLVPLGPGGHAAPALAHPEVAFGAVLDSMPNADARSNASSDEAGQTREGTDRRETRERPPTATQSLSASLAALLPGAALPALSLRASDGPEEKSLAPSAPVAGAAPSAPAEHTGFKGAAAPGGAPVVGKLVGERAFHAWGPAPGAAVASLAQAAPQPPGGSAPSPGYEAWPAPEAMPAALSAPPSPPLAHPRAAFAAVLDSMPNADARSHAPSAESGQTREGTDRRETPQRPAMVTQSLSASLASLLPGAALPALSMRASDGPEAKSLAPSAPVAGAAPSAPAEHTGFKGAAAPGGAPIVGKLVGERAFHAWDPAPGAAAASLAQAAPQPPGRSAPSPGYEAWPAPEAMPAALSAPPSPPPEAVAPPPSAEPMSFKATAPTPATSMSAAPNAFRVEQQDSTGSARASAARLKAPPPAERAAARQSAPTAPAARSGATAEDRQPVGAEKAGAHNSAGADPAQPQAQGASFGGMQSASLVAMGTAHTASYAAPPAAAPAPTSSPPRASPAAPHAPPVREIDVDLSPGGLEDVSMTMRLSGDKLSLVVRAASSQTTGAIEGVREAIAERLAAIGQPLSAFIIQQTGSTADGNAREASNREGRDARPQSEQDLAGDGRGGRRGPRDF